MTLPEENILQGLFQIPAGQITTEQLKDLIANEPYYGAAHLLLAKKLYDAGEEGYEHATQKAALHFPNELFLHYSLNANEKDNIPVEPAAHTSLQPVVMKDESFVADAEGDFSEDEMPAGEIAEDAIFNEKLTSILQQQAASFEKPAEPITQMVIETTPLHRIDYFESQGIKLEDEKNNDKLGSQLRRFTDWLKQMKRINPNPTELQNDVKGEKEVQNIAEHSNEPEEIITETMAEVLMKQGKPQQAIEIYEKLSFNNPSKSAYFAAKIAEIKS